MSAVILLLIILAIFGTAALAGVRAAPWVPSFRRDVARIIALLGLREGELMCDLGSGDGRILTAVAKATSARVVGYEISLLPYVSSWIRIVLAGMTGRATVRFRDFIVADLSEANAIFCFLTPMAMKKLAPKFQKELKPGTRIVSYSFSLPGWEPERVDKPHEKAIPIFVYTVQ